MLAKGGGTLGCAAFNKLPAETKGEVFSWAQGYLSGRNIDALATHNAIDLDSISGAEQERFLANYCQTHSSDLYLNGVGELVKILRAKTNTHRSGF